MVAGNHHRKYRRTRILEGFFTIKPYMLIDAGQLCIDEWW
jgi:hypothetical protein